MPKKGSSFKRSKSLKELSKEVMNVFYRHDKKHLNYKQVAKIIGITDNAGKKIIIATLNELAAKENLLEVTPGKFKLKERKLYITGTVETIRSGAAFIISPDTDDDVYISARRLKGANNGDTVKVNIFRKRKGRKIEGEVVEIISRAKTTFVGVLELAENYGFVIPDDNKGVDIFIPASKLGNAQQGQKVIAEVLEWPKKEGDSPLGRIIDVLGLPGDNNTEIHAILSEFNLPRGFPESLEKEGAKISREITAKEIASRKDMRNITTFTIDPVDAKDFDDALSFKKLENGNYEIGVHIADVTHYVKPDSLIEKEARERATSIYLVDRVIPMLPEILSNDVCSLRPHEDKLCYAAIFEIDEKAKVRNQWFGRTVIHSDRRFTYEEVYDILQNEKGDFCEELTLINDLAKQLRATRISKGAIAFDRQEVKFSLNEKGDPTGVFFKQQNDAHKLIEEFMLLANRKVAEFIGKPGGKEKPKTFVYRVHDSPDPEKLSTFAQFVKKFGYKMEIGDNKTTTDSMNKLLSNVKGKNEANLVETLAIRTMAKAIYTTNNIGHYGLAFDYYSHFTSPIRRYPDMMVHRLLDHYLKEGDSINAESQEELCKHASKMEKLAEEAERASIKFKQVQFLEDRVGEEFEGTISGITEWGIFVEINENKCEGLIRLRSIGGDYYDFDEKNYRVIGRRTKKTFQLGDSVNVKLRKADVLKKQLDFSLLA